MAEIPDGGSSGGGSTTSICTVNPSDNVSIINNLISRISDIEKFLSQLVGADVHADNLSELADNIGNILNGTITLPGDGNSPYGPGGSIPVPDGFTGTVISGNVITTWTDGVVSFQVIPSTGVTVGGGSGLTTALFSMSGGSVAVGPTGTDFTFTTVEGQSFVTNNTTSLTLSAGLYLITVMGGSTARTGTSAASTLDVQIGTNVSSSETINFGASWASGESTGSHRFVTGALVARFPDAFSNFNIIGHAFKTGSPTIIMGTTRVGISKLGA